MNSKLAYCFVSISPLRADKKDQSEIVSQLLFGEIVHVEELNEPWFRVKTFFDNYEGWIDGKHVHFLTEKEAKRWMEGLSLQYNLIEEINSPWGKQRIFRGSFLPSVRTESFKIGSDLYYFQNKQDGQIPISKFDVAKDYLNTPYLWGGKTPFGIDCSGLTQQVFRFFDINLPRDASQQVDHGLEVDFEEIQDGDVAFFQNKDGKIIHVGILNDNYEIIHASGHVRIDTLTKEGIVHSDTKSITHFLNCIKRM